MEQNRRMNDVVCVLNPDVRYQLIHYYAVDEASMTTPYDLVELERQGMKMPTIKENVLLARHPYEQQLFELNEQSEDKIVLERIQNMMTILSYLGAKYCKIKSTSLKLNDKSRDIYGSFGVETPQGGGEISGEYHATTHDHDSTSVFSDGRWPGVYTLEGYKKAVAVAERCGLNNDCTVATILEGRNPEHPSPMMEMSYSVDVRSDLDEMKKSSLDLKAKIEKAKIGGKLSGGYAKADSESRHNTLDFEVEFGPLEVPKSAKKRRDKPKPDNSFWRKNLPVIILASIVVILAIVLVVVLLK